MVTTSRQESHLSELDKTQADSTGLEPVELLWHRRNLLWKSAAVGFLVVLLIAFLIPKQYESTTRLMPPDPQAAPGAGLAAVMMGTLPTAAAGLASTLTGLKSPGALYVGVLQSRTVQDDLIANFDLRSVYSKKYYYDARKKLTDRTNILEDTKSGIIRITVTDNDPGRARALAAGYVTELNNLLTQVSTSSARRERIFLEDRLKQVKQELDEATLRLSKFSSKNMTFEPEIQGKAMLDAAATLQGDLIAAESELQGLEQIYGPENARVKAGRARIAELQSKLRGMSRSGGLGKQDDESLNSSELYPSLEQLPLLGNTYIDLERRAKIDEAVYEVLTKQYELARVEEAKEIATAKVLDQADLPEKKAFPPRLLLGILGCFLGLAGSASYLLLRRQWQRLDPEDPRKGLLQEVRHSFRWPRWWRSRV